METPRYIASKIRFGESIGEDESLITPGAGRREGVGLVRAWKGGGERLLERPLRVTLERGTGHRAVGFAFIVWAPQPPEEAGTVLKSIMQRRTDTEVQ